MKSIPALLLPPTRIVGLSISEDSLRAVVLNPIRSIEQKASIDFTVPILNENGLIDIQLFEQSLQQLWKTAGFKDPYVAVTLPESFSFTRAYHLPPLPVFELQEAIAWHIKDLFPFPLDTLYYDWKLLSSSPQGSDVIVVSMQKTLIDQIANSLHTVKLKPLRFEPDASALTRLIPKDKIDQTLLVELERKKSHVTLVVGGKSLFTTVVSHLESEPSEGYVSHIREAIGEVLHFYVEKGITMTGGIHVVLTGSLASEQWNSLLKSEEIADFSLLNTGQIDVVYLKSFAAAAYEVAPPEDPQSINLLPRELQVYYDDEVNARVYFALAFRSVIGLLCICSISVILFIIFLTSRSQIEFRVSQLRQETQAQPLDTNKVLEANGIATQVVALDPLKKTPKEVINKLLPRITEGISISEWQYDDATLSITLRGVAASRDSLLALRESLETEGSFGKITLPLTVLESSINIPFAITFVTK